MYIRPFQVIPLPESTFQVEANIIAAKTPVPSGVVNAYQGEISISLATRARLKIRNTHRINDSRMMAAASQPPSRKNQSTPSTGQIGKNKVAVNKTTAPNAPRIKSEDRSRSPR